MRRALPAYEGVPVPRARAGQTASVPGPSAAFEVGTVNDRSDRHGAHSRRRGAGPAAALLAMFAMAATAAPPAPASATQAAADVGAPHPLSEELTDFAQRSGLQLIYVASIAEDVPARAIPAGLSPRESLAAMLAGSGIEFEFLNAHTVRLFRAAPAPAVSPAGARRPAAPPRVAGEEVESIVVTVLRWSNRAPVVAANDHERHMLESASRDLELRIERSDRLYARPDLDRYLQSIVEKLRSGAESYPDPPGGARIRVVKDDAANAFALPDGALYVTTELLNRLGSEAELAAILGREMAHYSQAHVLCELHSQERKDSWHRGAEIAARTVAAIVSISAGIRIPSVAWRSNRPIDVGALVSRRGYAPELEREADYVGLRLMAGAGYDASAAVDAFDRLSRSPREAGSAHPAPYASPRNLEERLASVRALTANEFAAAVGADHLMGYEGYQAEIAGLGLDEAEWLVDEGRPERALALVAGEIARGDSGRAAFLEGEIARSVAPQTAETQARALAAYARAIALGNPPAATFRQQGILYRRQGALAEAEAAFRAYLDRAPQAADAPLVRLYLDELVAPTARAAASGSER